MPFLIPEHTDNPTPKCCHEIPADTIDGQAVPPPIPDECVADTQDSGKITYFITRDESSRRYADRLETIIGPLLFFLAISVAINIVQAIN